jgi:hypothetical protein
MSRPRSGRAKPRRATHSRTGRKGRGEVRVTLNALCSTDVDPEDSGASKVHRFSLNRNVFDRRCVILSFAAKDDPGNRCVRNGRCQSRGGGRKARAFSKNWNSFGSAICFFHSVNEWAVEAFVHMNDWQ